MKKHRKNKPAPPPGLPPEQEQIIEKQPKKQPFLKRLLFGEETPDLSELEAGSTTILDILSPTSVDTKSRDYIVVDGIFHAYLYITGYGYSTTVGASWLAPLVEAGEGVSISFHFDKQSKEKNPGEDLAADHDEPQPDARRCRHPARLRGAGQRHRLWNVPQGRDEPAGRGFLLYAHAH